MQSRDLLKLFLELFMGEDSPFINKKDYFIASRGITNKCSSIAKNIANLLNEVQLPTDYFGSIQINASGQTRK